MQLKTTLIAALTLVTANAYAIHQPAPVDKYPIHADGGLIYNPLSREAESTGQLARYDGAPSTERTLRLGRFTLRYSIPKKATAYDVVPIRYRLSWKDGADAFPVAVEATGFEEPDRSKGAPLYDLALPGKLDLKVTYLGSITAAVKPELRNHMAPDLSDKPGTYPPFARKPFVSSGVVEGGDLVWFKYRVTNTGNTILDSEGFGGISYAPELLKQDAAGAYQVVGVPYNRYLRELGYLYPGESRDMWVSFRGVDGSSMSYGLTPGKYTIRFRALYRWYGQFDDMVNMWEGRQMVVHEQPLTVEAQPRRVPVPAGRVTLTDGGEPDKITRWLHTFEEFMTAFDCHISEPKGRRYVDGVVHLQVAPWTKRVVVKLIHAGKVDLASDSIPIDVESESLKVKYDSDHPSCLVRDGRKEPVILSLTMADMRANVQRDPFPERSIATDLREMRECGINVVSTTCMPWLYDNENLRIVNGFVDERVNIHKHNSDGFKYALDVARREGIAVEGWGSYPYNRITVREIAQWITGRPFEIEMAQDWGGSYSDPNLPIATAAMWLYQFHRWGDLFYRNSAGDTPITVEDTRGMLRQDINGRWYVGAKTLVAFREWVRRKYGTLDAVNAAWGSRFGSFEEIDPEANQVPSPYLPNWPFLQYTKPDNVFHDWSQAMEDFDIFRTEMRVKNYEDTLALVRAEIPSPVVSMRTEGSNVVVAGIDPQTQNPHMRHIYYSQRRGGAIAEVIDKSGVVKSHTDFPTLPFTPRELRWITRTSVGQGIVPSYMPQFDNMRDMVINDRYGSDFQVHYNLPAPAKGAMIHVLTAVYPWFQATYEEGGTPGILWQDFECDGFSTETQRREMRLFESKLTAALNTPSALADRTVADTTPSRAGVGGKRSY